MALPLVISGYVALALSAGVALDAGTANPSIVGRATLTVSRASFDGRELRALALICANEDGVFVDDSMAAGSTFDVRDVLDCALQTHVNYTVSDASGRPAKLRELRAGTCIGRNVTWRLHRLPTPARSGCVDVVVGAYPRNEKGELGDLLLTTIRVQP